MTPNINQLSDAELVEAVMNEIVTPYLESQRQPGRCRVCGWPLAESHEQGCVEDNCSMRPLPEPRRFRFLESWDDVMFVEHCVAMKDYAVRKAFQIAVTNNGERWFADIDKTDVLRAALAAIRSRP